MVEGTSFMGLGGPNLVKGATGQVIDSEPLGGARMHTAVSGVAHYLAKDDAECLALIRQRFRQLPAAVVPAGASSGATAPARVSAGRPSMPYEIEDVLFRIFDSATT
jgi:acetyl-CoA carboxylase carboxyltransferase component